MISEGLILLNNVKNTKVVDIKPMMIEGTALIRFAENVTINNTVYLNKHRQIDFTEPHPPTILNITTSAHNVNLSLPYLHRIYLDNTNLLQIIEVKISHHKLLFILTLILILSITIGIFCYKLIKKQKPIDIDDIVKKIQCRSRDSPI